MDTKRIEKKVMIQSREVAAEAAAYFSHQISLNSSNVPVHWRVLAGQILPSTLRTFLWSKCFDRLKNRSAFDRAVDAGFVRLGIRDRGDIGSLPQLEKTVKSVLEDSRFAAEELVRRKYALSVAIEQQKRSGESNNPQASNISSPSPTSPFNMTMAKLPKGGVSTTTTTTTNATTGNTTSNNAITTSASTVVDKKNMKSLAGSVSMAQTLLQRRSTAALLQVYAMMEGFTLSMTPLCVLLARVFPDYSEGDIASSLVNLINLLPTPSTAAVMSKGVIEDIRAMFPTTFQKIHGLAAIEDLHVQVTRWIEGGFAGYLRHEASLYVIDQCLLGGWHYLADFCLVVFALCSQNFLACQSKDIFMARLIDSPRTIFTAMIAKSFVTLNKASQEGYSQTGLNIGILKFYLYIIFA